MLVLSRRQGQQILVGPDSRLVELRDILDRASGEPSFARRLDLMVQATMLTDTLLESRAMITTWLEGRKIKLAIDAPSEVPVNRVERILPAA
ncbi:MAG: hypothetical protein AB7V46_16805 [Thermomicrobiales bacterium]